MALDTVRATRDAEARRCRLQVRLGLVAANARSAHAGELLARAEALRRQVDAISVVPEQAGVAAAELAALEPQVIALQAEAGVEEYGLPLFPKWMKFLAWTAPLVLVFGALAFILERRRRRRTPGAEALAALEAAAQDD